jgi:predicted MFS family arabinose efflux permease
VDKRAAVMLAGAFLVLFIGGGSRFTIGLTLKAMVDDFGSGRGVIGLAVALFLFVSAAAMFIAGRIADRVNSRGVLVGGLVLCGAGIGLLGLAWEPWQVVALYGVLYAIGSGLSSIAPIGVMVTRWFPGRTGLANAVAISGMALGQLVMIAGLAAVLAGIGWRWVYFWIAAVHVVALPVVLWGLRTPSAAPGASTPTAQPATGLSIAEAARTPRFWLLLAVYAICGFDDFFVSTHIVAFAQDRGLDTLLSGNLLALMGLTALIGVLWAGAWADKVGPGWPTLLCFVLRIVLFGWILFDQSALSVGAFALLFGATYLVTAPLTVLFVRDAFGTRHLGALSGLITMVHHMCGGLGAWAGAALFDQAGRYDAAFALMAVLSVMALGLCVPLLRR